MTYRRQLPTIWTDPIWSLVLVVSTLLTGWVVLSGADVELQFTVALAWFGVGSTLMLLRRPR